MEKPGQNQSPTSEPSDTEQGAADKFARSTRKSLGIDTPFLRNNYTRVTSSMRIAGEVLTILSGRKFQTPERSIGASVAIVSGLLGVVFKQQPQLKEELEKLSDMSTGEYVALRLKQALEPQKHIRQTLAAGMMATSVLGMLASARSKRVGEGLGAAIGFVAACILSFTRDDKKAWERQSVIMGTLAAPVHIGYGVEAGMKKGDMYIPAAAGLHTAAHALTFLETFGQKEKGSGGKDDKSR